MLSAVSARMHHAVEEGVFPGAVLLTAYRGEVILHEPYGWAATIPKPVPMQRDTLFDLASLTKPIATASACLVLMQKRKLRPDQPVRRFFPEYTEPEKSGVTIQHLLNHSSGLRAWKPLYEDILKADTGRSGWIGSRKAKRLIQTWVRAEPLSYPPGTQSLYSDLGFLLLQEIVEKVSEMRLDRFCEKEIFGPLEMPALRFGPVSRRAAISIAATEDCPWRKRILVGEVHDDNAYVMGGVAGHAGLFGTAEAVWRFLQGMRRALLGKRGLFSPKWARRFVTRPSLVPNSSWALGWDTPSSPSSSGRYFSRDSFGHLGYTGCSMWMDPRRDLAVVLLTNRVHPTRQNTRIREFRPEIHDLIGEAIS
jgi:CubicO group peptidase (beta-lactamase class C family)